MSSGASRKRRGPRGTMIARKCVASPSDPNQFTRLAYMQEGRTLHPRLGDSGAELAAKSVRDLIDKPSPVDGDALLLYGMMHDFERRWLKQSPDVFMATMTETMIEDVARVAPLAATWLATLTEFVERRGKPIAEEAK
jgi:hypothetical protein